MTQETGKQLAKEVITFLYSPQAVDGYDQIASVYGLNDEGKGSLSFVVEAILKGELNLDRLPVFIQNALEVDETKAKSISVELAGRLLTPLSVFVPGVDEAIQGFGGDPAAYASQPRVEKRVEDIAGEAKTVAQSAGELLVDPVLQGRLEQILLKYLSGELNQGAAIELMRRPPKVGGLGVTPDQAQGFLAQAESERSFDSQPAESEGFAASSPVEEPQTEVVVPQVEAPVKDTVPSAPAPVKKTEPKVDSQPVKEVEKKEPVQEKKIEKDVPEELISEKKFPVPPADLLDPDSLAGPGAVAAGAPTMTAPTKPSLSDLRKQIQPTIKTKKKKEPVVTKQVRKDNRTERKDAINGVHPEQDKQDKTRQVVTADSSDQPQEPKRTKTSNPPKQQQATSPQDQSQGVKKALDIKTEFKVGLEPDKPEKAGAEVDVFSEEDAREIAEIKKRLPESSGAVVNGSVAEKVAAEAGLDLSDETLKGRFEAVVDSRLRDLRDVYETRNQLEDAVEKGGLGISGGQLAQTVEVLERYVRESRDKAAQKLQVERQEKEAAKKKQLASQETRLKGQEQQVLAKRYAELTGQAPTQGVGLAKERTSGAKSREQALSTQEAKIDTEKVRQAVNGVKQERPAPLMSAATISPKEGRPQVQDVRFARRLAGPVDELRVMNVTAFRRLSLDPKQAVAKIKDKIDLLSFEDKVAAVQAWRESPINQLYVSVAQESLSAGKAIPEIIKLKESQGGEMLTQEEVAAIVSLNSQLRF